MLEGSRPDAWAWGANWGAWDDSLVAMGQVRGLKRGSIRGVDPWDRSRPLRKREKKVKEVESETADAFRRAWLRRPTRSGASRLQRALKRLGGEEIGPAARLARPLVEVVGTTGVDLEASRSEDGKDVESITDLIGLDYQRLKISVEEEQRKKVEGLNELDEMACDSSVRILSGND